MTSCSFNATIPGTGDFIVASAALGSATPEQSNVADGNTYGYYAQNFDSLGTLIGWESGSGIYTISTHTLKRTTITANSNGDTNPVNFPLAPVVNVYANAAKTLEPALSACAVWAVFDGATATIQSSFNVASVTRSSAGIYLVNFIKPFANNFYSPSVNSLGQFLGFITPSSRLVGSVGISFTNTSFTATDPTFAFLQIYGKQ